MKINLIQGSSEWLQFRRTKIMGSEISAIVGENPWLDSKTLWSRKLGIIPEQSDNEHMQRGRELEHVARDLYCKQRCLCFEPEVHISDKEHWAACSLDGINLDGDEILEIKCPKKQINSIPTQYLPQIHWNLFVTGANICHFVSFVPDAPENEKMRIFLIERADVYIENLVEAGRRFYEKLMKFEEPDSNKEEATPITDEYTQKLVSSYFNNRERIRQLELENESLKASIISHVPAKKSTYAGITIQEIEVSGRINYKDIPELRNLNLEIYRGPTTKSWRIT